MVVTLKVRAGRSNALYFAVVLSFLKRESERDFSAIRSDALLHSGSNVCRGPLFLKCSLFIVTDGFHDR
jgi:hypothetical protein